MTTSTNKLIDIDAEFDDVYFDETEIKRTTGSIKTIINREANGWAEKNKEGIKKRPVDYGKKISITGKEVRSDPVWKQGWMKTIEERDNNPEYRKNHLEGVAKRTASKEWQEKNNEARKKFLKPIVTPFGIFISVKDAIEKIGKSEGWLMTQRKRFPQEYYLISQEEYIMLTGKDI